MKQDLKLELLHLMTDLKHHVKDGNLLVRLSDTQERLQKDYPYVQITAVHREDLANLGMASKHLDEATLERIASDLGADYCRKLFHPSLKEIAEKNEVKTWQYIRDRMVDCVQEIITDSEQYSEETSDKLKYVIKYLNKIEDHWTKGWDKVQLFIGFSDINLLEWDKYMEFVIKKIGNSFSDKGVISRFSIFEASLRDIICKLYDCNKTVKIL